MSSEFITFSRISEPDDTPHGERISKRGMKSTLTYNTHVLDVPFLKNLEEIFDWYIYIVLVYSRSKVFSNLNFPYAMEIQKFLNLIDDVIKNNISDLHLTPNDYPYIRNTIGSIVPVEAF